MYLDHLKSNFHKESVPAVSFSECLEAALYCTEVHSAADAYLIKAEAEYMYASEAAEAGGEQQAAAEGGFWAKIKAVVKKMWEALKGLLAKAIAYVKSVPAKLMNLIRKIAAKLKSINIAKRLENVKDNKPDAAKLEEAKFIDITGLLGLRHDVVELIETSTSKDSMNSVSGVVDQKLKEIRESVEDKNSNLWVKIKDYSQAKSIADAIVTGRLDNDVAKALKDAEDRLNKVNKEADNTVKRFQDLYNKKDDEGVKAVTKELATYRAASVNLIKANQLFATIAARTVYSKVTALNKYIAACKPAEKADDKDTAKK